MERTGNNPARGITPQGRRGSPIERFGLPPPMVRIYTDRTLGNNVRKVQEIADQHGAVMAVSYEDNGLRTLKKIRYRLSDAYTASLQDNDPQQNPDRYRREQHRMLVTRIAGPAPDRTLRPIRIPELKDPRTPGD